MIKFNKHNVTNTANKAKCRVFYSLDNHVSHKPCVTIYAKSCLDKLSPVLGGVGNVINDSDSRSDYFEDDRVRLFEDHPLYEVARRAVEAMKSA